MKAWTEHHLKKIQVVMDGIAKSKSGESDVVEENTTVATRHAVAAVAISMEHEEAENMEVDVEAEAEDAKPFFKGDGRSVAVALATAADPASAETPLRMETRAGSGTQE